MSERTKQGVGTTTKQAEPISEESENMLWNKGLLGDSSSNSILNTVFFYNSKLFDLRGVDEHRELCVNQISIGTDQNGKYIIFNGRANKTYKGKIFVFYVVIVTKYFVGQRMTVFVSVLRP